MKKLFLFVLFVVLAISCKSTSNVSGNVSDITEIDWKLILVQTDTREIIFDRRTLTTEDARDIFTLRFDAESISGTGAPNRYSAPYTLEDQGINIMLMRSTLMASLWQPEKLREQDFFIFMQNAYEWRLVDNNLEIHSRTEDGSKIVLVFSL